MKIRQKQTRINGQIRVPEVRLIGADGNQVGVMSIENALLAAKQAGLDLVEIAPTSTPPVCCLTDFGKYAFEQSKRRTVAKKKQKLVQVKEIKFRPATDVGDYNVKVRKIATFLERGDKVKISLWFKGREMRHRELAMDLFTRIKNDLQGMVVEQEPKLEGRQVAMVVAQGKLEPVRKEKIQE